MQKTLRFHCRGAALVTDINALDAGIRRHIGRRYREVARGQWAFAPTGEAQEVPYHPDYVKACRDGDLWPSDEETAKACGVPYDPTFGGQSSESDDDDGDEEKAASRGGKADV